MAETATNEKTATSARKPVAKLREPTAEQKEIEKRRLERASSPVKEASKDTPPPSAPLEVMTARGVRFQPDGYDKVYFVAAFPIVKLVDAGAMIAALPTPIAAYAMSHRDDDVDNEDGYSLGRTADVMNQVLSNIEKANPTALEAFGLSAEAVQQAMYVDEEQVAGMLANLVSLLTKEDIANMLDLAILALQRRHPDIDTAEVEEWMDIPNLFDLLRTIFKANTRLKDRF